eukprot:SAG31_NODE_24919_length_472_cov_0.589812_1_plen_26_part_10
MDTIYRALAMLSTTGDGRSEVGRNPA